MNRLIRMLDRHPWIFGPLLVGAMLLADVLGWLLTGVKG